MVCGCPPRPLPCGNSDGAKGCHALSNRAQQGAGAPDRSRRASEDLQEPKRDVHHSKGVQPEGQDQGPTEADSSPRQPATDLANGKGWPAWGQRPSRPPLESQRLGSMLRSAAVLLLDSGTTATTRAAFAKAMAQGTTRRWRRLPTTKTILTTVHLYHLAGLALAQGSSALVPDRWAVVSGGGGALDRPRNPQAPAPPGPQPPLCPQGR